MKKGRAATEHACSAETSSGQIKVKKDLTAQRQKIEGKKGRRMKGDAPFSRWISPEKNGEVDYRLPRTNCSYGF